MASRNLAYTTCYVPPVFAIVLALWLLSTYLTIALVLQCLNICQSLRLMYGVRLDSKLFRTCRFIHCTAVLLVWS